MEDRRLLAVFTVINTNNANAGSLRQAIIDANNMPNVGGVPDEIHFNIPGGGVQTIQPTSELDAITEAVIVNGYTAAIAGQYPKSPWKILFVVVLAIIVLLIVLYASQ